MSPLIFECLPQVSKIRLSNADPTKFYITSAKSTMQLRAESECVKRRRTVRRRHIPRLRLYTAFQLRH